MGNWPKTDDQVPGFLANSSPDQAMFAVPGFGLENVKRLGQLVGRGQQARDTELHERGAGKRCRNPMNDNVELKQQIMRRSGPWKSP